MRKELRKRLEQEQKGMRKDWEALRQIPESGWDLPRTTAFLQQELEKMEVEWSLFQSKAPKSAQDLPFCFGRKWMPCPFRSGAV